MRLHNLKLKTLLLAILLAAVSPAVLNTVDAQEAQQAEEGEAQKPRPIILAESKDSLEDRLARKITLDVRDMNIVDILKFLALKGDFNVVISPTVEGKTTVLLHNVAIKDALDIVIISNRLSYSLENNIVQVMTSAEFEAIHGKKFSDKTEVAVIHLQYSKPSYVLAALDNIKTNVGKIIIDEDTGSVVLIDTPQSILAMKAAILQLEKPLETVIYALKYAKADVIAEKLRSRIDAKAVGSITADERTNQLMVRVFPERRKEVEKIISELDSPTKEVLITARILQIVLKPKYDVGIDWNLDFRSSPDPTLRKLSFNNMYLNEDGLSSSDNLNSLFGKIGVGDFTQDEFQLAVRALQQVSDTKILSNPQILVTNNEEAKIHIGDTVPYIISTVNGTGDNAITSEDVRFIDVGLKLDVTPVINDDGIVTMRLRPEISNVVGRLESSKGGIPQVNKTEVETTLMVKDGMTIVMAGLRKEDKSHIKKGLPVLMNIPYLEKLFSRTTDSIESTEVVILITPHILKADDNYMKERGTIKPPKSYSDQTALMRAN
jgi:type II secretory pathway component GspD/PulD (secretin)